MVFALIYRVVQKNTVLVYLYLEILEKKFLSSRFMGLNIIPNCARLYFSEAQPRSDKSIKRAVSLNRNWLINK